MGALLSAVGAEGEISRSVTSTWSVVGKKAVSRPSLQPLVWGNFKPMFLLPKTPPVDHAALMDEAVLTAQGDRAFRIKPGVTLDTTQFLARFRPVLELGPDDDLKEYLTLPAVNDAAKRPTLSFRVHHYKGLPILGTRYVIAENSEGSVMYAGGRLAPGLSLNIDQRGLSDEEAFAVAKNFVGYEDDGSEVKRWNEVDDVAISSKDYSMAPGSWAVVYRFAFSLPESGDVKVLEINADTGEIWNRLPGLRESSDAPPNENVSIKGIPVGGDAPVDMIGTKSADGLFSLQAHQKAGGPPVSVTHSTLRQMTGESSETVMTDENGVFGEPGEEVERFGTSLHAGLQSVMRWFQTEFSHIGFDGSGNLPIQQVLYSDFASHGLNAISKGSYLVARGVMAHNYEKRLESDAGLQVVAHEYTHGIADKTARLTYYGDAAPIEEGIAYCFDALVKWEQGATEDLMPSDEKKRPKTYEGYFFRKKTPECGDAPCCFRNTNNELELCAKGVDAPDYYNFTIQSYMFYLLVEGGTGTTHTPDPAQRYAYQVVGIGKAAAQKIAFQALTVRMPPTATFQDAREAWIQAARDVAVLWRPEEAVDHAWEKAVTDAWNAVGVGEPWGGWKERACAPSMGGSGLQPWSLVLGCEVFDNEDAWKITVCPQLNCTKETQEKQLTLAEVSNGKIQATFDLKPDTTYFWVLSALRHTQKTFRQAQETETGTDSKNLMYTYTPLDIAELKPSAKLDEATWITDRYRKFFTTGKTQLQTVSPTNGASEANPWKVAFSWKHNGADAYRLIVTEDAGYKCAATASARTLAAIGSAAKTFQITVDPSKAENREGDLVRSSLRLNPDRTYFWFVLPLKSSVPGTCSNDGVGVRFRTGAIATPTVAFPKTGDFVYHSPHGQALSWKYPEGAGNFVVELTRKTAGTVESREVPAKEGRDPGTFAASVEGLNLDLAGYCWRVKAKSGLSESAYSPLACPKVVLTAPRLVSPANGASNVPSQKADFQWTGFYAPEGFDFRVAEIMDTGMIVNRVFQTVPGAATAETPFAFSAVLEPGKRYEWSVRARSSDNAGATSEIWRFATAAAPTTPPPTTAPPTSCADLGEARITQAVRTAGGASLSWSMVGGASSYAVQITQIGYGSNRIVASANVASTQATVPFTPLAGERYIANVLAVNSCGQTGSIQGKGIGL